MPVFAGKRPNKPEQHQFHGLGRQNSHEEQDEDTQCAALVEIRITRNKHDARSILESYKPLVACNYKVMVSLGTIGVWNTSLGISLAISKTGARPNLVKRDFFLAT